MSAALLIGRAQPFVSSIPTVTAAGAVSTSTIIEMVGPGHAYLVHSFTTTLTPGAGQSAFAVRVFLELGTTSAAPEQHTVAREAYDIVALRARAFNWSGDLLVPAGWRLRLTAQFDGGAANTVLAAAQGLVVPFNGSMR